MSMIQVEHLTFSYDGSYDTIFEDVLRLRLIRIGSWGLWAVTAEERRLS